MTSPKLYKARCRYCGHLFQYTHKNHLEFNQAVHEEACEKRMKRRLKNEASKVQY